MEPEITSNSVVRFIACSCQIQRKHQSSALPVLCEGKSPLTVDSQHKRPVMWKWVFVCVTPTWIIFHSDHNNDIHDICAWIRPFNWHGKSYICMYIYIYILICMKYAMLYAMQNRQFSWHCFDAHLKITTLSVWDYSYVLFPTYIMC